MEGCARKLFIRFENQQQYVDSYCGLMNIFCYDCSQNLKDSQQNNAREQLCCACPTKVHDATSADNYSLNLKKENNSHQGASDEKAHESTILLDESPPSASYHGRSS